MEVDQAVSVKSIVKDTNGEPTIEVTVKVKGSATGSITDMDGNYSVSVLGNKSVCTFSFH